MSALFLKNATVTHDGTGMSADIDNLTFTPTTEQFSWVPFDGVEQSDSGGTTWVMTGNIAQDYGAGSFFMKLYEAGDPIDLVFRPRGDEAGPQIAATVTPAPATIGGGRGALTASVSLKSTKPVLSTYTPAP